MMFLPVTSHFSSLYPLSSSYAKIGWNGKRIFAIWYNRFGPGQCLFTGQVNSISPEI